MTNSERIRKIGKIFMDAGLGFGSVSDHEFFDKLSDDELNDSAKVSEALKQLNEYNSNVSTSQNKYSDEIMRIVRQRLGLNAFDTSKDSLINEMDKGEIFDHVCKWEGFVGYSDTIKGWVLDIYGVDLDDYDS